MPTDVIGVLDDLAEEISSIAEGKGFWDVEISDNGIIPTKLALVHSEVSEALEVYREGYDDSDSDPDTGMTEMQEDDFTEELADGIIRYLDLAGYYDLDIGRVLVSKVEKNKGRPYRHGKRF